MNKSLITLLTIFAITPLSTHAEEAHGGFSNNVELSAVQTSGNTKTLAVNTKGKSVHEGEKTRQTLKGSANGSSNNNQTTAESYQASLQEDWKITERDYLFCRFSFESDRFAGFKRRLGETVGYGRYDLTHERWTPQLVVFLLLRKPTELR
ncbi:MAG: hypothetical protein COY36_07625, partial [Zetaproteobacteria bacterium CG_4_10_14_0_2_um_filter_55_20]